MIRKDFETVVILMLAALLLIVCVGLDELLRRVQPRVVWVHQGGKDTEPESKQSA